MATTQINGGTQIKAATITDSQIASAAAIASSKLADGANFLKKDGTVSLTGDLNLGTHKITNLVDPVSAQDAATKAYVDATVQGLDIKLSVRAATTANITLSGTQTVDGIALSANDRVLVKNQSTGADNGIYLVAAGAWTRAADAAASAQVTTGLFTFVEQGTVNGGIGWVLTTANPINLSSTALVFTQFSGVTAVTAGDTSITVSGSAVSVNIASGGTLTTSSGLKVASGGITGTELNTSVAGAGLTGGGGSALAVACTDGSISVGADAISVALNGSTLTSSSGLKVSSAGISETEIASSALSTTGGLTGGSGTKLSVKIDTGETIKSLVEGSTGLKINTSKFIKRETPTGSVNSVNAVFTTANAIVSGSEEVFLNGLLQDDAGNDYTFSAGNTITFVSAPLTGDKVKVNYISS